MKVLVLNAGSSSMKFKVYAMNGLEADVLAEGNCQRVGLENSEIKYERTGAEKQKLILDLPSHQDALAQILKMLTSGSTKVIDSIQQLDAVGHRVSMGGAKYVTSVLLNEEVVGEIESLRDATPLHTPPQMNTIYACQKLLGKDFPMVVGFDTAFHQTMPPASYLYGIPYEFYEKHGLRKFCFHGLSHQFVTERYAEITGKNLEGTKIITCHLGGGSSVTAVQNGKSVDNSFGFGSGEGPVCGTRAGSFDHSAIPYMMQRANLTYEEVEDILNRKSGLLGLSGISSDEKELEELAMQGNARAKLALDVKTQQVKKYIGSYAFEMGGLDAIVFTGGIGENSEYCRSLICKNLEAFGIKLDEKANVDFNRTEHKISAPDSQVEIWIIPTNEELVIARDTKRMIEAL